MFVRGLLKRDLYLFDISVKIMRCRQITDTRRFVNEYYFAMIYVRQKAEVL